MKYIETHGIHPKYSVFPCVSTCFHVFRFQTSHFLSGSDKNHSLTSTNQLVYPTRVLHQLLYYGSINNQMDMLIHCGIFAP